MGQSFGQKTGTRFFMSIELTPRAPLLIRHPWRLAKVSYKLIAGYFDYKVIFWTKKTLAKRLSYYPESPVVLEFSLQ